MQPGMYSPRVDQMSKRHLIDIAQSLIKRMRNNLQDQGMVNSNKAINRVINDLADWRHCCVFVKGRESVGGKCTKAAVKKLFLNSWPGITSFLHEELFGNESPGS